ncbi:alpha-N-arabinofuranosidase [Haloferula helveola]|uniref:non-reducing end alpha-L-arabinofuranosidase n=1 Tax=Haloferula helveola TaxID=490095 RepID=A0ABM7RP59_9BACT|nr:alpha-N-arabinofuranosidase [Haloferula helveola]
MIAACSVLAAIPLFSPAADVEITVDVANPSVELSPHLYGLFFEDINFAADGGLYAELIQNRSFEYHGVNGNDPAGRDMHPLFAWEKVERDGARCLLEVSSDSPIHANNPHHAVLRISKPGSAGIRNLGFDGIRLDDGARYDFSLYARVSDWQGPARLDVVIEDANGKVAGTAKVEGIGEGWAKFDTEIFSRLTSDVGRLIVSTPGQGTLHLDMVSLFPQDTWKARKGGLRKDLVETLQNLNPKFMRFPGGCIAHGQGLENAYSWKDTVGDVAERKPNWNLWGYHQTYGLGYFEYFLLCEDLGMAPLPVVPVGVSCGFRPPQQAVPMEEMDGCVQDALDLIEFANGPVDSEWGAVRAGMGHPEPFGLEFICIGNEPHDNELFRERFPLFVKAVREAHPDLKIIGTSGLGWQIPIYDLMAEQEVYSADEHYYESPEWFLGNVARFDSFDRSKPKIFIGEYASKGSSMFNAVAEAAYLTGVERNADIVDMTCYAPLFGHAHHSQWNPDMIYFDKRTVVRSANYHVQQMFSQHKGDVFLPNTVRRARHHAVATVAGSVGFGSWRTSVEVEDLKVNGVAVDPSLWRSRGGQFLGEGSRWSQTDVAFEGALRLSNERYAGKTVAYTLRARKTGGDEGFLIAFGGNNHDDTYWWNLGGWNNSLHAIEQIHSSGNRQLDQKPGVIESGRWYDLKIELGPGNIRCFLDQELVHDVHLDPPPVCLSSTLDRRTGEVILKLVNPTDDPMEASITLEGVGRVDPAATLFSLSGDRSAINTIFHPDRVRIEESDLEVGSEFDHTLPAMSVQFIRIKRQGASPESTAGG